MTPTPVPTPAGAAQYVEPAIVGADGRWPAVIDCPGEHRSADPAAAELYRQTQAEQLGGNWVTSTHDDHYHVVEGTPHVDPAAGS